ncbi:Crp/Fnr family transcriptional regulator [Rhizobium sp. P32RR-XVIII]|uniref:Crp/Fnr family transcriptional regulator n=1 Tax=Rhizobium sp. P32RR-XVIII TaxID=2726738 RepID=UPI0014573725|nr:Crp/Fnr family transcriptional regulator [Rhizobium sp. P32RR-XVIII]NLS06282.1 Crp/Fnr family transcriptional regulator [Rhizobium sp. P32RR-XVIII]
MLDGNATPNILIAAMDRESAEAVLNGSELIDLKIHQQLQAPHKPIQYVYFPETGLNSIIVHAPGGLEIETGLVGKEGVVGTNALAGIIQSPDEVVVQIAGSARRLPLRHMQSLIDESAALEDLLIRYLQTLQVQIAGTALANGRATIVQRLARWLLMCQDRIENPHLALTHEYLSTMLGTRRAGVTTAIHVLEGDHLIRSTRGVCTITNRPGLIERAGGIYGAPETEYRRLIVVSAEGEAPHGTERNFRSSRDSGRYLS